MDKGLIDLLKATDQYQFETVLDIGTGSAFAARYFDAAGKSVTATGFDVASYITTPIPSSIKLLSDVDVTDMVGFASKTFDAVWCSHVLEHTTNPGLALREMRRVLKDDGILFIILPEYSPFVVGGHVSVGWNIGVLMYALLLAGFNVRDGHFVNHCWNLCAFVRVGSVPDRTLRHDCGDIEALADLFPSGIRAVQGFDGDILHHNWQWGDGQDDARKRWSRFRMRCFLQSLIPPAVRKPLQAMRIAKAGNAMSQSG